MNFSLVVATDLNRGIGLKGDLPWRLKGDLAYFRDLTSKTLDPNKKNAVIMGRTTWDSIPEKFRPLPNRLNIVLSNRLAKGSLIGAEVANSLQDALLIAEKNEVENCFVIGGGKVYQESILLPECQIIYITEILENFSCDTYFPPFKENFKLQSSSELKKENNITYQFAVYQKIK
jgi:dihydrofolate reductase